jgi:hypothetical protein
MTKHYSRSQSVVSRDTSFSEVNSKEPSWFSDFVSNLEKESAKSKKDDYSIYDQINSILGNKSKYSTVEEAVLDMQKRTGLTDLINQKKQAQDQTTNKHQKSKMLNDIPQLKTFIDNYVEDRPGASVESVVHDVLKVKSIKDKLPDGDDLPDDVRHYINDKITEVNMLNPKTNEEDLDLGKLDMSSSDENTSADNDPFGGCEPVKK